MNNIGLDIGSTSTKLVVVDDELSVEYKSLTPTG